MRDQLIWHYLDQIDYFVGFFIAISKVNSWKIPNFTMYIVAKSKKWSTSNGFGVMKKRRWLSGSGRLTQACSAANIVNH